MKEVDEKIWRERMGNLIERRKLITDNHHVDRRIADYHAHLSKIEIGEYVLDIGCGSMDIKKYLPAGKIYLGIDAFPVSNEVVKMKIEDCYFQDNSFDTLFCFAVLDGLQNLDNALQQMKRVCRKNMLFLTGVNIPPDKFHTLEITEDYLSEQMHPFKVGYKEFLSEKVLLIEYRR